MAFTMRNVEKFIDERPLLAADKKSFMKKAEKISEDGTLIVGAGAEIIFGKKVAIDFFIELGFNSEHQRIWKEYLASNK